jgi:hypothetical protein
LATFSDPEERLWLMAWAQQLHEMGVARLEMGYAVVPSSRNFVGIPDRVVTFDVGYGVRSVPNEKLAEFTCIGSTGRRFAQLLHGSFPIAHRNIYGIVVVCISGASTRHPRPAGLAIDFEGHRTIGTPVLEPYNITLLDIAFG